MLKVEVKKGNIERALKEYKSKVIKTRQMRDINDKVEYEKPSVKKRKEKKIGVYRQKKRRENE